MKKLFILAAALLLAMPFSGRAETVDRIAAVVNNDIITTFQLDKEMARRQDGGSSPEERRQALEALIEESLIAQRVAALGLKISEEELEAAVQDVQKQNKLTREQLVEALRLQGMDFAEYRESLRRQILRFKLLGREVQAKVEVTNQEVRDYFREHIDEFREAPNVRLHHLTFPIPARATGEQIETIRRQAEEALVRLRAGEEFTTVLLTYSADRRAQGGELGTFQAGELSAAFEAAVRPLQEGEVSEVVETPQGFHLLQVTERNPGRVRQFDSAKDEITKILTERNTEERFRQWSEELRKKAYIDVRI